MSRGFDDDALLAQLRVADDVAGWIPDVDAAFERVAAAATDLTVATTARPQDGRLEVRIGDLAVVHTLDEPRRRGRSYAVIVAAAAAIALVVVLAVVLVPGLMQSSRNTDDRLAVSPLHPATSAQPATSTRPASPAPLSVTMSLSATTVHAGGSITVNYAWSDGNGRLLYLNHVGMSATKVVRPPACTGPAPAPQPGSGHGSWTFTLPVGQAGLIEGLSVPFDHPERIKVGVQIGTGGQCGPVEEKTVTQWVTLYPG